MAPHPYQCRNTSQRSDCCWYLWGLSREQEVAEEEAVGVEEEAEEELDIQRMQQARGLYLYHGLELHHGHCHPLREDDSLRSLWRSYQPLLYPW